jgi:hypothetical protein
MTEDEEDDGDASAKEAAEADVALRLRELAGMLDVSCGARGQRGIELLRALMDVPNMDMSPSSRLREVEQSGRVSQVDQGKNMGWKLPAVPETRRAMVDRWHGAP